MPQGRRLVEEAAERPLDLRLRARPRLGEHRTRGRDQLVDGGAQRLGAQALQGGGNAGHPYTRQMTGQSGIRAGGVGDLGEVEEDVVLVTAEADVQALLAEFAAAA